MMLTAYAAWHGSMLRTEGGAPLRDSLIALAQNRNPKVSAKANADLTAPWIPPGLAYLWHLLVNSETGLLGGATDSTAGRRVTWLDLRAWRKEVRLTLATWEKSALMQMSNAFLSALRSPAQE